MAVWPSGLIQRGLSNRAVRHAELKPEISVFYGETSVFVALARSGIRRRGTGLTLHVAPWGV